MSKFLLPIFACVTLCLTGCFSLEATKSEVSGEEHVWVRNQCWRLFNFIPLVSGNATEPGRRHFPTVFFRDDAQMDKLQHRMFKYAQDHHRRACDLVYHNYETVMFELPLFSIPIPIPYVFCYHEIQLSGVLK